MPASFDLVVTANPETRRADLRLLDAHGNQLAYHQADFQAIPASRLQGLFDLRKYFRLYVEEGDEARNLAEIGVSLAEQVLGEEVFRHLSASTTQRTLRLRLPGAAEHGNDLAQALARVPWELARPDLDQPTLGDRNLLVRVVAEGPAPAAVPMALVEGESLRILFVFAESRGSRPLAARKERRELLRLFEREVYPQRQVVAHFLTHGVTRERLRSQIQEEGGYHVLHWSGHGHRNLLEVARPDGTSDPMSGEELLALLTEEGLPLPRLVFLSACHSGEVVPIRDWGDFFDRARGKKPVTQEAASAAERKIDLSVQPGYTGTAHALLAGGVPSVVAMRYEVGDEYTRDLAVELYRSLLADPKPKSVAAALNQARRAVLRSERADERYDACDPATPILYGAEDAGLILSSGRSPALAHRSRRLPAIAELSTASHEHFVGRTWELAGLGAEFIGSRAGAEVRPVALIVGLGGMGKTALVAEALALWEERFAWLLLFQAKPSPLAFEATLRDIHLRLIGELGIYPEHLKHSPADAIYRDATGGFTGPERLERLTDNLIRALQNEPILLVLDNFETNLKPDPEPAKGETAHEPLWACQDPAWERCLSRLATELSGSPSRVLVTCRRPLSALAGKGCHRVQLGPLPRDEAAVYLRQHPALVAMVFGGDEKEEALAIRLLAASRFHPLLLDRLARLATGGPALRPNLLTAIETLEGRKGYEGLPSLFAKGHGDPLELAYLNDALAASLDQLIAGVGREPRRLLWIIAVANEPVAWGLMRSVWKGEEAGEQAQLRQIQTLLNSIDQLPPEQQGQLKRLPPELRALAEALPPLPDRPEPALLLRSLLAVGLATEERAGPEDENPDLACHELVRERIRIWMDLQPDEREDLTENGVRLAYADRLEAAFHALLNRSMATALEAGRRALIYRVQAGAYDRLGSFASSLVTSARSPRLLAGLLPYLEAAAEAAPEGRTRWSCLFLVGDALRISGRPDASLPFYKKAAAWARQAIEEPGGMARLTWGNLAATTSNWAIAVRDTGDLATARQLQIDSTEAFKKAGRPFLDILGSELQVLRIDILLGNADQARPQVEAHLAKVETWWERSRGGQTVPEAPDSQQLARVLLGALDIVNAADRARNDWKSALHRTDRVLAVKRTLGRPPEDLASTRMNRAVELTQLRRFQEAQAELEECLRIFENDPTRGARTLSALADLFDEQGDLTQSIVQGRRALALLEQLPDPNDRAGSHNNLGTYLWRTAMAPALAEASRHQLAALLYRLVAGLTQELQTSWRNYAFGFRRARAAGTTFTPPRVAELLADPAFHPLDQWLRAREVDLDELQTDVDDLLEQVYQAVLAEPEPPGDQPT